MYLIGLAIYYITNTDELIAIQLSDCCVKSSWILSVCNGDFTFNAVFGALF
jgi:hypothetical protein